MPSQPADDKASNSGIVTDRNSGQRHIPESIRADGSTRKAIKVRPGYRPPEDVELYKSRAAETFRDRGKRIGIPGAASVQEDKKTTGAEASSSPFAATATAAGNKNAKRREARKKAKAEGASTAEGVEEEQSKSKPKTKPAEGEDGGKDEAVDPQAENEKKARNLKKKLKQAKELQNKKEGGETLLPEQIAKVIKISELIRGLEALGFDVEGEPLSKVDDDEASKKD
ncbi:partner of Y14 and mago [Geosmithia morbida]|uniref:Partner of Y14 and mago n=1 Tax=Geosmithia morbida TaxID=1094350 RepID=A0A9P5D481_9HYPO|nr:partner of Y14 and mago [Geosmithia morbida]KAF4122540.1 partner of Y14 and mago [Geosmithia morbida]